MYKRLSRSAFVPLRIRAWLECGVVCDNTLPVDGLFYYLIHRERYGRQDVTASRQMLIRQEEGLDTALPLARVDEHGPAWYYAASFAQWPAEHADGQDAWSKRLAVNRTDFLDTEKKKTVDVASGPFKSYRMPVFYRHALHVDWYVRGEPERIRRMLSFFTHLGKKTEQGWGAVSRWEVERVEMDWSVRGPDGRLMRAIPSATGILFGIRPSYWLPRNQTICELP